MTQEAFKIYDYCIVGQGAAGILLLLALHASGVRRSSICVIDPYFDGGALRRDWGHVQSNTTWSQFRNALSKLHVSTPTRDPNETTPLAVLADFLHSTVTSTKMANREYGQCVSASYRSATQLWTVKLDTGVILESKRVFLCQGSTPTPSTVEVPRIPFNIALDPSRLQSYVHRGDRIVLFGTAHSGTLIYENLRLLGASVTAIYKHDKPFEYARDGVYGGIKQDSAAIADLIQSSPLTHPLRLIPLSDTYEVNQACQRADWIVSAVGFQSKSNIELSVDGTPQSNAAYDSTTGELKGCPMCWGFGIAYPSRASDGIHVDVGIASFVDHILSNKHRFVV